MDLEPIYWVLVEIGITMIIINLIVIYGLCCYVPDYGPIFNMTIVN